MSTKFRLSSNGKFSCMELCGKTIGKGVNSICFSHDATDDVKKTRLILDINLDDFEFLEDGYFDRFDKALDKETEPPLSERLK